ncbi:Cytochrome b2 [Fusarium oxysporum f. sp. albedinis]|nr:Cytochrome b2 [Fusarium oxysporum f. sp. albedinis]
MSIPKTIAYNNSGTKALQCPHPECPVVSTSPEDLWLHLADIHSTSGEPIKKRKTLNEDSLSGDKMPPPFKRHCAQSSIDRQAKPALYGSGSHLTFVEWVSSESLPRSGGLMEDDSSSLSELSEDDKIRHENGGGSSSDVQSSLSSTSFPYILSSTQGNDKSLHPHLQSNPAISSGQDKKAGQQPPQDVTALSGTHDFATSSSTGIESVPQRGGTPYSSLLSPYSIDDMTDSKGLSSNEASGLLQAASIVKADTSRAQLDESNDNNFGNAHEASKRLQFILSTSENSDIIDPQLYIDQNCEEDLRTKDGYASSTRQNRVSASEMGQPTALDPDGAVWEVDRLLAKCKQGRRILYLVKWKGCPDDANAWEKRKDISID